MDTTVMVCTVACVLAILSSTSVLGFKMDRQHLNAVDLMVAKRGGGNPKLFFKGSSLGQETIAERHQDVVLTCEVGGSPSPTIHWLKDGVRIQQGPTRDYKDDEASYETDLNAGYSVLLLGKVKSRLFLDCVTARDEAVYTCVAETPYERITQSTKLVIDESVALDTKEKCMAKKAFRGEGARIYMWTAVRMEYEGAAVQLLCRAEGYPAPTVTWRYGKRGNVIENDQDHEVLPNGDLLISDIAFASNMGNYYCSAKNEAGLDEVSTFLYPTLPEDE